MRSTFQPGSANPCLRQFCRAAFNLLFDTFLNDGASGGIVLMVVALLAIITANWTISEEYFGLLHLYLGPLSRQHWINDALMAIFFLLVGLEIKREMLDG